MDFEALTDAKPSDFDRERAQLQFAIHARKLNPRPARSGVTARLDRVLVRLGHAASKRQARRAASGGGDPPVRGSYS